MPSGDGVGWGGSGGEAGVAAKQRRREVGCFLARAAEAAGKGNKSDAEALRNETNKLKEAPAALIVKLPSGSAGHDSHRLHGPFRQPDALSSV